MHLLCLPLISSLTLTWLRLKSAESSDQLTTFKTVISSSPPLILCSLLFSCHSSLHFFCIFLISSTCVLSSLFPSDLFWSLISFAYRPFSTFCSFFPHFSFSLDLLFSPVNYSTFFCFHLFTRLFITLAVQPALLNSFILTFYLSFLYLFFPVCSTL